MSFNVGDVVKLKSGGPKMTVKEPAAGQDKSHAVCLWFNGNNESQTGAFPADLLKIQGAAGSGTIRV